MPHRISRAVKASSTVPHSPRWRWIALACSVVMIAGAVLVAVRARHAPLPQLDQLGDMAPDVAGALRQALVELQQDPRDGARWGRFAMLCEANGLTTAARDGYAAAASLNDSNGKWWYRRASVEMRLGQSSDAMRDIRRAIERAPEYVPAHWRLGQWLVDENDLAGAERAFARAGELDPDAMAPAVGLARVDLQRHQESRAVDRLEQALARHPGDRYALQLLGTAYRRAGRSEEAELALAAGAGGEPMWADPWTDEMLQFRRGFAVRLKDATQYFVAGQTGPAISLLEQLRAEKPDNIALLGHLGEAYVSAGRAGEGVTILERVVATDPQRFEAWVNLAAGYLQQNALARARAAIERAIAISPGLGRAWETKALIEWRGGDERRALESLRTAVRFDPRDVRAFVYAGMLETNLSRPANAIEMFARATRIDPTRADAWIGIANAAMTLGDLDRAAAALGHASHLDPDGPAVKQATLRLQALRQ